MPSKQKLSKKEIEERNACVQRAIDIIDFFQTAFEVDGVGEFVIDTKEVSRLKQKVVSFIKLSDSKRGTFYVTVIK